MYTCMYLHTEDANVCLMRESFPCLFDEVNRTVKEAHETRDCRWLLGAEGSQKETDALNPTAKGLEFSQQSPLSLEVGCSPVGPVMKR